MSAFMVSPRTCALVARAVLGAHDYWYSNPPVVGLDEQEVTILLGKLADLNVRALDDRYPGRHAEMRYWCESGKEEVTTPEDLLENRAAFLKEAYRAVAAEDHIEVKQPSGKPHLPWLNHCNYDRSVMLVRAMDCYLYQCAEGEAQVNDDLYKRVKAKRDQLCGEIVSHLPLYEAYPWG